MGETATYNKPCSCQFFMADAEKGPWISALSSSVHCTHPLRIRRQRVGNQSQRVARYLVVEHDLLRASLHFAQVMSHLLVRRLVNVVHADGHELVQDFGDRVDFGRGYGRAQLPGELFGEKKIPLYNSHRLWISGRGPPPGLADAACAAPTRGAAGAAIARAEARACSAPQRVFPAQKASPK